jgi:hypothetical protein
MCGGHASCACLCYFCKAVGFLVKEIEVEHAEEQYEQGDVDDAEIFVVHKYGVGCTTKLPKKIKARKQAL